ncbi:nuclear transport factor 2 family protein [Aeromicrobium wangtongii]|uniref:Nuclear transport factor 2 family protein n=1 Tax=Aeromicrobium wangtongii TaxID=2969247 RepID=A0ABY5M7R4_9ACTN|nr:nuclear transport factor 2 family protein [Aeromicrobium wangtongii]MCD9199884.1 nuclear transport factor 2 family protein [Aeromicrobium wangtongii]UUP13502.1 nuclear transport factor 2 family protein [Aeromicrobium wangtongii]
MTHPHIVLLDRIMAAAEASDASDLPDIYTPDAVIWHNHDDREQTVEQNARMLTRIGAWVDDLRYTDRRVTAYDTGAVQQHVLRGTRSSTGEQIALHACVVITVTDGRISRLDEYIDSAEGAKVAP